MNLGVGVTRDDEPVPLPPTIGSFKTRIVTYTTTNKDKGEYLPMVSCDGLLDGLPAAFYTECVDPEVAVIKGSDIYRKEQAVEIVFVGCFEDKDMDKKDCLSPAA